MRIYAQFDSGNIEVVNIDDPENIQLRIRKDSNADYSQWFHFQLLGAKSQSCRLQIMNASETSYAEAWTDYQACASYDRAHWFRVNTRYEQGILTIEHTPDYDSVYYAYFPPYSYEQHQQLLSSAQLSPNCQLSELGPTLDQRPHMLLTIGETDQTKLNCWIIARQHAGETMAEWFMEGLLQRLLDKADPVARKLLQQVVFYLVPNMNPDGAARGNLRANAAGTDLNRSWRNPSLEQSPEVYYVRAKMQETGVDFFLDVHGDEGIPYNFLVTAHNNPSYSERQRTLASAFSTHLLQLSPDFQTEHGYGVRQFGDETLKMATNYVADAFSCLAFTLEMPFKDNNLLPDRETGWSPARAKKLAHACLDALHLTLPQLLAGKGSR